MPKKEFITNLFPKTAQEIKDLTKKYIPEAQTKIDQIINIEDSKRTFTNTFFEFDKLCCLSNLSIFSHAIHAIEMLSEDEKIRQAAHEAIIQIQSFFVEQVSNNKKLYTTLKSYATLQDEKLTEEEKYFIQETIKDFKRSGLDLPEEKLEKVKKLNKELGELNLKFESNIAKDQSKIKISNDELCGLDDEFISTLQQDEDDKCIVGIDYPTYFNIMDNCQVEETRKKIYLAFNNRAYPENENFLKKIIEKRDELAKTIGFKSYCHLDIDSEMAANPERAEKFLSQLNKKASVKEQKEFDQLVCKLPDLVALTKSKKIKAWDKRFIKNQYKKKHLNIDEKKIAEYFPMDHTIGQLLKIYEQFFNLKFTISDFKELWHKDIKLIEIYNNQEKLLGYLIVDLYPRPNKYSHACQMTIVPAVKNNGPAVAIVVANFPKPAKHKPSLLQRQDVETFFHEFGHALHSILGRTNIASFSGTNVKTDFVEMPSQMLEEWLADKEILKKVSCHYKTNEQLPDEIIEKILSLKHFDSGDFLQRQCYLSCLALECFKDGAKKDPKEIANKLRKKMRKNIEFDQNDNMYASFGHLSGYGARYYGYMWAKVFALDLFSHIKKHGLLNPQIGKKYADEILCKGGSQDPNILLKNFLGREPNEKSFFEDLGIL